MREAPYRTPDGGVGDEEVPASSRRPPARILRALATLTAVKGSNREAEAYSLRATHALSEEAARSHQRARAIRARGRAHFEAGEWAVADAAYREALLLGGGNEAAESIDDLVVLGTTSRLLGRLHDAAMYLRMACSLRAEPQNLPVFAAQTFGALQLHLGHAPRAAPVFERALNMALATAPSEGCLIAHLEHALAVCAIEMEQLVVARHHVMRALARMELPLGIDHPVHAWVSATLARIEHKCRRLTQSEEIYARALRTIRESPSRDARLEADVMTHAAELAFDLGREGEADHMLESAQDRIENVLGPENPGLCNVLRVRARIQRRSGRDRLAAELEARAQQIATPFGG